VARIGSLPDTAVHAGLTRGASTSIRRGSTFETEDANARTICPMTILVLLLLALPGVLAAVDAVRIPDAVWRGAGYRKPVWIGLIVLLPCLGWLGALIYFVGIRPSLGRSARRHRTTPLASGA